MFISALKTNIFGTLEEAAPEETELSKKEAVDSFTGPLTKSQLRRMIPGFIRVEALLDEDKYPAQPDTGPVPVDLDFGSGGSQRDVDPSEATAEDAGLVRQVLKSWENGNHPIGATKRLLPVIFDFFAHSNNPRDAHVVLRTLYSLDTHPESSDTHFDRLQSLLSLWSVSEDEKAPWRMDELLRDIESASSAVNDDVYILVAESWIRSQATDRETSSRKALSTIHKVGEKDSMKTMAIVVQAITDMMKPSRKDALLALRLLKSNWDTSRLLVDY